MPLRSTADPLVPRFQTYGPDVSQVALRIRNTGLPGAQDTYTALNSLQEAVNDISATLRQNPPAITELVVVDDTGNLVAFIGDKIINGYPFRGTYSIEMYVGDSVGDRDPRHAPLHATASGQVIIGQGGAVDVLDPYGGAAAWIGSQNDTQAVTGAVDNGTSNHLIRLTVVGTTLATGDSVQVAGVGGVPNAIGIFTVTKIDADHIDLQNSIFAGTYTSGGTVDRLLHITGAANNGSGLIRLTTAVAHAYLNADEVNVTGVGGVPNATGQWLVTVVDTTHIDLVGSTFAGTYTTGGTCLRFWAGIEATNIAIGNSFDNYSLRMFPDGTLRIKNASISIDGPGGEVITIDASGFAITSSTATNVLNSSSISISDVGDSGAISFAVGNGLSDPIFGLVDMAGFTRVQFSTTIGWNLYNAAGVQQIRLIADPSGSITIDSAGDINTSGIFRQGGVAGVTGNLALTVNTDTTAVNGTPGTGQSNFTAVTSVTLTANAFSGGIRTT